MAKLKLFFGRGGTQEFELEASPLTPLDETLIVYGGICLIEIHSHVNALL